MGEMEDDTIAAKLDHAIELLEKLKADGPRKSRTVEKFWALEGLRERMDDPSGDVMLVGAISLPSGETYDWQQGASTEALLENNWAERIEPVRALGHPVRLSLLQAVLKGQRATAELAAIEGVGTTGQLHHHLRMLVSAGWLQAAGRGHYEVPATRVIPLLAVMVAAAP